MSKVFDRSTLVSAIAVTFYSFLLGGCAGTKTGFEQPEEAVATGIALLESKDYAEFVKQLYPPPDLEKLMKDRELSTVDEVAKRVLGDRPTLVAKALRDFKLVQGTKPLYNDDRTQATFRADDPHGGKSAVVPFILVDGRWYLPNAVTARRLHAVH